MIKCTNLIEVLRDRMCFDDKGITFIEGSYQEEFLSYHDLYHAALNSLAFLQSNGLHPKDELVLQIEDNRTFIITFWACILGGIIPIPLTISQNADHKQKLFNIWAILEKPHLIISQSNFLKLDEFIRLNDLEKGHSGIRDQVLIEEEMNASGCEGKIYRVTEDDIAFIQFSSGSTDQPKGIVLTHKNLIANMEAISKAANYSHLDSMISWMPLTHDMGMIGFHLNPLFCGMNQFQIPTNLFIRRPSLWFEKASIHKVNILCSPNFGYKYIIKHCSSPVVYDWDLAHVRIIYNGAEPISEIICHEFLQLLSAYGLKSNAMCPVYGLAEASLAVSISGLNDEIRSIGLSRQRSGYGSSVSDTDKKVDPITFVNVGKPIKYCDVRIADHHDIPFPEEIVGHVQIIGNNVTSGYYNNEVQTKNAFTKDGWFRTGDLGFIKEGSLYITGRAKEIIFVNGQNYYPHDIEKVAETVEGIELNKIVFAGSFNQESQSEEIISFVFHRGNITGFIPIMKSLKSLIGTKLGLELDHVIPVKDIPRTTSGKLQRFKLLEQFKEGNFRQVELILAKALEEEAAYTAGICIEPENDREEKLLEIWKSILKEEKIGVLDSFFELGGNSLKAAELAMVILKEFELELPLALLYKKQTIRELSNEIPMLISHKYTPIPLAPEQEYYPVSSAQKRLYYAWEANRLSLGYNIPLAFKISGTLEVQKLEDSIRQLILRYDVLRMSFQLFSEPKIKIHKNFDCRLNAEYTDITVLNEKLKSFVVPFDLNKGPLFRFRLLNLRPDQHVLFLDFHHIISDGVSISLFISDLMNLYEGRVLHSLAVQYKDYVCWEENYLQSEKIQQQVTYWVNQLNAELPQLEIPCDFPRPAIFDTSGEKIGFELTEEKTRMLKNLSKANECTLQVLLFAVYSLLLVKYSGQKDIVVGIPVAGRRHPDLQKLQGMFVNSLAIRCVLDRNESFTTFLKSQKDAVNNALEHQDYPYGHLFQHIVGKRDVSRNPLFDTMFTYQNMVLPKLKDKGVNISMHFFDPGFSKFDLSLEVFEEGESMRYFLEYSDKLFKKSTVLNLSAHFEHLMDQILLNPEGRLSDLNLITKKEHEVYINLFNATKSHYLKGCTIEQLFEEQVRMNPHQVAIKYTDQTITYKELNDKSNALAILLRNTGVVPDKITAVLLPRSPELIISMLGILKAGGCYLPIDTDLPEERIKNVLSHSQCHLLITLSEYDTFEAFQGLTTINFDQLTLSEKGTVSLEKISGPKDLAYVIYTSGTTGKPKGVMIEHQSLVNYISWAKDQYIKNEKLSFALYTSISFDLTVTSIFTPLVSGGQIVIYNNEEDGMFLERIITDNCTDVIKLTPSHLKILRSTNFQSSISELTKKIFIVGGEELETKLAREVYHKFEGKVEIFNEYGPTEATVGCMIHKFNPEELSLTVPIGIPAANTQIYVLDKSLSHVPAELKGELYIAGDSLARGYLFEEDMTSQKFVPNPFAKDQRMYKTGDIVKRHFNGNIEFIGRSDRQVKINGYRIELSEIESHLSTYKGVTEALVILKTGKKNQRMLSAYYKGTALLEESVLRNYLASKLPYYMIPAHLIRVNEIPLTKNGKVDYNALPEIETENKKVEKRLPKNSLEQLSLKVWSDVLGLQDLSITDNFYEMGGDSIKAVQISSRLFEMGFAVKVKDILTYHTIEQVSVYAEIASDKVEFQGVVSGERSLLPIESWFFNQNFSNPNYYNQSVWLNFHGKAELNLLTKAFKLLIAHHDGLRLNYHPEKKVMFYNNSHLVQDLKIDELVISETFPVKSATFSALKSGFDITGGCLIKPILFRNSDKDDSLFITAHHLVIDGISWRVILEDLYTLYSALKDGAAVTLPQKTVSLLNWEKELQKYSKSEISEVERSYWNLVEETNFSIPVDFECSDWKTVNSDKISKTLEKEATRFLLKESQATYQTDVPILLNIALARTLGDWTESGSFVIEQESHGRHLESVNASRTLGWFTSMYPIKLELKVEDSIRDQIKSLKEQIRNVPNYGIGYGILNYSHSFSRGPGHLSEIRINYLGQFDRELNNNLFSYNENGTGSDIDPENLMTAKVELNLMILSGELILNINYNKTAHKASTICWFADTFFAHLHYILEHIKNETEVYFTPSDFGIAGLDQEELDALF